MANGVARILVCGEGPASHAGMGIVLDRRHILTCAHVLNVAMKRDKREKAPPLPDITFGLHFPFAIVEAPVEALTVLWMPMGEVEESDIAVLEVPADLPDEVGVATLKHNCDLSVGEIVKVYGRVAGEADCHNALGTYVGDVGRGRHQFNGRDFATFFVKPGYSGAAVWDREQAVVGMAMSRYGGSELAAYMTSVEVLRRVIPTVIKLSEPELVAKTAEQIRPDTSGGVVAAILPSEVCRVKLMFVWPPHDKKAFLRCFGLEPFNQPLLPMRLIRAISAAHTTKAQLRETVAEANELLHAAGDVDGIAPSIPSYHLRWDDAVFDFWMDTFSKAAGRGVRVVMSLLVAAPPGATKPEEDAIRKIAERYELAGTKK